MPDHRLELGRHAAGVLAPGERLLAAVRAMPVGPYGGSLGIFSGAVVGAVVQSVAISRSVKKALLSRFPMSGRMAIGITDTRILIWNRGGFTGRTATNLVGEVPLARLSGITIERIPGRSKMTFRLRDGQAVTVEADRRDEPERFAEVLDRYLAHRDAAAAAETATVVAESATRATVPATASAATAVSVVAGAAPAGGEKISPSASREADHRRSSAGAATPRSPNRPRHSRDL